MLMVAATNQRGTPMAVFLVTYDLKEPGRDYAPVHAYLRRFTHSKGMESVWLLDTHESAATIRDALTRLVHPNDIVLVVRLQADWAACSFRCGEWLNEPHRTWQ